MKKIAQGYGTLGKYQYQAISPYMNAGTQALSAQLEMLANPINNQQALSDYYASPQYAEQEQAAEYALNSQAEATGGLGNTATGNALAAQTTQMGQNYLTGLNKQRQQQFTNLGGLSKQGLNATTTAGKWASDDYNKAAGYLGSAANAQANAAAADAKRKSGRLGGALNLASYGAMFI
ncbi:DNA transfer protein [Klebsiella aerogenes]|uniref:DNA transfer protein n=1 Tax=Klebsiella aerogenes TaxID=548 RepID=UPI00351D5E78